jgi:CRP/FNR family transcriptional regulator
MKTQIFNSLKFLIDADEKLKEEFEKFAVIKKIPKGKIISLEGDSCNYISFVSSGRVRVYKIGESGREITLYRLEKGESCILTASCILSNKKFPAISSAENDVEVILIPSGVFKGWIEKYDLWRNFVYDMLSNRLADVIEIIEEVAFKQMDKRIIEHLLKSQTENKTIQVTHQEIARELGTSREVVSRILKDLEHKNLINLSRGSITLENLEGLNEKLKKGFYSELE